MDVGYGSSIPTPLLNSALLPTLLMSLAMQKHSPDTTTSVRKEYDYVIVGAGAAGSVVASRLSEIPCISVLLLEAGGTPPLLTEVPGISAFFRGSEIDWKYKTAPQKYAGYGLNNNQVAWPSGKTLGGSSVMNSMDYARGNRKNYDRWAAEGAKGWSYEDVLPYFKKLEDNRDPNYLADGYHGSGGPLTVETPLYEAEIDGPLFKTVQSMGYEIVDPNGYRQTGFYDVQGTTRGGQRCSTAKAYLVPAENRTNLDILPHAMVRKVLIKHRRAIGVQFDFDGHTFEVRARREVIMSAGTVNTAQLLLLSGIGPRRELELFNIPQIADLPVGLNFHDHGGSFYNFLLTPHIPTVTEKLSNPSSIKEYIHHRTGPLASLEFISALAFLKTNVTRPKKDFPDYELYFFEGQTESISNALNIKPEIYAQAYAPYEGKAQWGCLSHALQPKSRGTVTLHSTDPYDSPIINPNYYQDPRDLDAVVEGLKTCMRIASHPIMKTVGSTPYHRVIPGCEKYVRNQDSYLRCLARNLVMTFSHQVGTARMGDPHDPRTVVDPELRVLHVDGLRVVDASVMPIIPSGNTYAPVVMVAEKASDIIKSSIKCYKHPKGQWRGESSWINDASSYPEYYSDQMDNEPDDHNEDWAYY